jgi:hypothetical protein
MRILEKEEGKKRETMEGPYTLPWLLSFVKLETSLLLLPSLPPFFALQ